MSEVVGKIILIDLQSNLLVQIAVLFELFKFIFSFSQTFQSSKTEKSAFSTTTKILGFFISVTVPLIRQVCQISPITMGLSVSVCVCVCLCVCVFVC